MKPSSVERAFAWASVAVALGLVLAYASGASTGRWTLVSARRRATLMASHSTDAMVLVAAPLLVLHTWTVRHRQPWADVVASAARAMLILLGVTERALDVEVLVVWIVAWCNLHPVIVTGAIAWSFAHTSSMGAAQVAVFALVCTGTAAVTWLTLPRSGSKASPATDELVLSVQHALAALGAIGLAANRK
jgi:hypothetical protein